MMAENVIETNKSNDIDVDKIQARNVQTFAQKLKQYKNHPTSLILYLLVWLAAIATMATVVFLIGYILVMGIPYINADIFSLKYTSDNCSLVPALVNTILMTLLSLIVAVPLGIFSAIYLVEYAKRGNKLVSIVRTAAETLQGIPSIVYGLFGMLFFVEALHWGYSLLAGSFTVAIMILPLIMRTTEEALLSVPDSYREGSFGLGAGKLRTVFKIVLPSAVPGILAGVIGSTCYNKFKSTKLPDWLSFFSGKRCVAIIAGVVSILVSVVLLFVWPILFGVLISIGNAISEMGALGAGIYAFLNRLLIPTGLHHALNNVFWFDTIGLGDLTHFWAGETSADVSWSLGMYMSGFFPCMMFGIPGAALAMIQCAKDNKKKVAIGLVASAALCAFICGVTEPFEFGFMFLAPGLYVIYALLYGIFTVVTVLLGFRAGFSFSAGATDLLFSASLPAAQKTWLIIPLGIAAFIVFYVVFRFAILKFDLKTPGREDDDTDETTVKLANDNFTEVAKIILEGVGGKGNVASIDNCITRLRLEIKDYTAVDEKKIKSAGVAGVIRPGKNSVQVVIGTKVQFVADEFKKLCK